MGELVRKMGRVNSEIRDVVTRVEKGLHEVADEVIAEFAEAFNKAVEEKTSETVKRLENLIMKLEGHTFSTQGHPQIPA